MSPAYVIFKQNHELFQFITDIYYLGIANIWLRVSLYAKSSLSLDLKERFFFFLICNDKFIYIFKKVLISNYFGTKRVQTFHIKFVDHGHVHVIDNIYLLSYRKLLNK